MELLRNISDMGFNWTKRKGMQNWQLDQNCGFTKYGVKFVKINKGDQNHESGIKGETKVVI